MTQPPFGDEIEIVRIENASRPGDVAKLLAAIDRRGAAIADLSVSLAAERARNRHIAAAALRQAADDLRAGCRTSGPEATQALVIAAWLRRRADDLDGRQPTPDTREAVQARLDALRPTEATP